jgi:hypothetical protein
VVGVKETTKSDANSLVKTAFRTVGANKKQGYRTNGTNKSKFYCLHQGTVTYFLQLLLIRKINLPH